MGEYEHRVYKYMLGNIDITEGFERGCSYMFGEDLLILWYVSEHGKYILEELQEQQEYIYKWECYVADKLTETWQENILLLGKTFSLITCQPERWTAVIWYKTPSANVAK
jgi:hypothetical protein